MTDDSLGKLLDRDDIRLIAELADSSGIDAFLVGGCIRDALLRRKSNDLDFALSGSIEELSAIFASKITGSFFWLDDKRKQGRVVKKGNRGVFIYDFAPLCGTSIEEDLYNRDFTVNALAISLRGVGGALIDPLCGLGDIDQRIIRLCGAKSIESDPLRLMRAVRFSAEMDFTIEDGTWKVLCKKAHLIKGVASERIRDELFRTLAVPGCGSSLQMLCDSGIWSEIFPIPNPAEFTQSISCAGKSERLSTEVDRRFSDSRRQLYAHLNLDVEAGISYLSLLKLASFLGHADKATITSLVYRLRLGREAGRILTLLCGNEGIIFQSLGKKSSSRQLYRFFRDRGPAGPEMLIVARARGEITGRELSMLLGYYLRDYDPDANDLLLSGWEVRDILGIPTGKAVGEALELLRKAEAAGQVNNREEATDFVKNLLTKEEAMR